MPKPLKRVAGQRNSTVYGSAGVENSEQDALPFLHSDGLTVSECAAVDGKVFVGRIHAAFILPTG